MNYMFQQDLISCLPIPRKHKEPSCEESPSRCTFSLVLMEASSKRQTILQCALVQHMEVHVKCGDFRQRMGAHGWPRVDKNHSFVVYPRDIESILQCNGRRASTVPGSKHSLPTANDDRSRKRCQRETAQSVFAKGLHLFVKRGSSTGNAS